MKIHFWSSTEYSGFLEGLMRELRGRGFDARQRFQIAEASYRAAKSPFARLWLRVRQYLVYPVQLVCTLLFERLFRQQADVCVISTNTFYAPLLATFLHPNTVHLVYDLFPEAMIYSGKWRDGSLKVKCVRWVTRKTLKRARRNIFLGQRLNDYVLSIYGLVPDSAIIEVGADQSLFGNVKNSKSERPKVENEILYCGNFGNLHDSATLFDFWKRIGSRLKDYAESLEKVAQHFSWKFHCSGPKRAELIAGCEGLPKGLRDRIQIGGGLGQSEWVAAMKAADIALVTMAPGSETVVMPSKTYSAMMAGQAILAIAPEASDLVDAIKAADCGWWVAPGDVDGLENLLETICSNPKEAMKKRQQAHRYAHEHFGQDALAGKWQTLFENMIETRGGDD